MHCIDNNDVTLHVREDGSENGRVVMFGNSLGTDMRVWDPLLPHLPAGLRLVRYDTRGHGLSDCPKPPYSMNHLVDDALKIIETLKLQHVSFVGLSIGGLIGQALVARRPELFQTLVLMDTAAKIGSPELWMDRIAQLREGGLDGMADAVMERWFATEFRQHSIELAMWRNMLVRTPLDGYAGCCAAIAETDLTSSTTGLTLPVLAMVGNEDGATPPELVEATAMMCAAEFHVVDNAGHLPCVEKPAMVGALISRFLEKTA
ncbi:MAG: 3-oxoadipate enol-lactonase [Granulosicoccus sp.]